MILWLNPKLYPCFSLTPLGVAVNLKDYILHFMHLYDRPCIFSRCCLESFIYLSKHKFLFTKNFKKKSNAKAILIRSILKEKHVTGLDKMKVFSNYIFGSGTNQNVSGGKNSSG